METSPPWLPFTPGTATPGSFLECEGQRRRRDKGAVVSAISLELAHLATLAKQQEERGLSRLYRGRCQKMGEQWRRDLGARDLRHVGRAELYRILKRYPTAGHQKRMVVMKAICAFLVDGPHQGPVSALGVILVGWSRSISSSRTIASSARIRTVSNDPDLCARPYPPLALLGRRRRVQASRLSWWP
jgi:hypothetical protein